MLAREMLLQEHSHRNTRAGFDSGFMLEKMWCLVDSRCHVEQDVNIRVYGCYHCKPEFTQNIYVYLEHLHDP